MIGLQWGDKSTVWYSLCTDQQTCCLALVVISAPRSGRWWHFFSLLCSVSAECGLIFSGTPELSIFRKWHGYSAEKWKDCRIQAPSEAAQKVKGAMKEMPASRVCAQPWMLLNYGLEKRIKNNSNVIHKYKARYSIVCVGFYDNRGIIVCSK